MAVSHKLASEFMDINSQMLFAFTSLSSMTSPLPFTQDQLAADIQLYGQRRGVRSKFFITVSTLPWQDMKAL